MIGCSLPPGAVVYALQFISGSPRESGLEWLYARVEP